MFAWASTQEYFKDLTDINIREKLYKDTIQKMEEEMIPFGFIDDGGEETSFVDESGQTWHTVDDEPSL